MLVPMTWCCNRAASGRPGSGHWTRPDRSLSATRCIRPRGTARSKCLWTRPWSRWWSKGTLVPAKGDCPPFSFQDRAGPFRLPIPRPLLPCGGWCCYTLGSSPCWAATVPAGPWHSAKHPNLNHCTECCVGSKKTGKGRRTRPQETSHAVQDSAPQGLDASRLSVAFCLGWHGHLARVSSSTGETPVPPNARANGPGIH